MTNVAKEKREMIFVGVTASIVRETEKAYQVEAQYWTKFDQPVKKAKMWIPKSCSKAEDGKVTQIADFILREWEKERREYIKSYSSLTASYTIINWDLDRKERLAKEEAEKKAAYKKHVKETIAKYLPTVTECSHKFIRALGTIARGFGRMWKEEGADADACDEFITWGENICKKYGESYPADEYYQMIKKYDNKERGLVVGYAWETWIFGDFHANYYGAEKDFYEVRNDIVKKFKDEESVLIQYKYYAERLWKLNGNRW
jgi:hypothetical protein